MPVGGNVDGHLLETNMSRNQVAFSALLPVHLMIMTMIMIMIMIMSTFGDGEENYNEDDNDNTFASKGHHQCRHQDLSVI